MRVRTHEIADFIARRTFDASPNLVRDVSMEFGISRQAVHKHLRRLESEGVIIFQGERAHRLYRLGLKPLHHFIVTITQGLQEDIVYQREIAPLVNSYSENFQSVVAYSFMEMLNNAIDHSGGTTVNCLVQESYVGMSIRIADNGIGIFSKLQKELGLEDKRHALQELHKGKITTDPDRHSGEGIFFTSRACDKFYIFSDDLLFLTTKSDQDWLFTHRPFISDGTSIHLEIDFSTTKAMPDIYSQFSTEHAFDITSVPVKQFQFGDTPLVSRSQGKRLVAGLEKFRIVYVDFTDVTSIGQGFADEVFRVFAKMHPDIAVMPSNANAYIRRMIARAKSGTDAGQPAFDLKPPK